MTAGKLHTLGRRYSPRNLLRSLAIEKWRGTTRPSWNLLSCRVFGAERCRTLRISFSGCFAMVYDT